MCRKLVYSVFVILVLALVHASYGQVVIGDWENVMDGWLIDPCAPPGTTTSYSTTGVTLNANSLKVDVNNHSGWNQAIYIPLDDEGLVDEFFDNDVFSLDITRLAAEWTIADPCDPNLGWSDLHVIINADSNSGPVWIDLGADNSLWNYVDGNDTSTAKWNYSGAKAQIDKASISNLDLILVSNYDPNYTSGGIYYLDKARLEPMSYLNVIGNFENVMDGWEVADGNNASVSYSTTGVTLDNHSLVIDANEGFVLALQYSLIDNDMVDTFRNNLKVSMDITRLASEWVISDDSRWSGLFVVVHAGSSADPNWDFWGQLDLEAVWEPGDGNEPKNFIYDYSTTINEIDFNNVEYLNFVICTNYGGYDPGGTYYIDNIQMFGGGPAYDPQPANGAREVMYDTDISWTSGVYADKHDVYFGTNFTDVNDANRADPRSVLVKQDYAFNSYNPGELRYGKTYYWRIDEVNESGPDPCLWPGEVWNFTTAYPGSGVVIGDWEDTMDNWAADQGSPNFSFSTTGATLNDKSLCIETQAGYWIIKLGLSEEQREDILENDTVSLDVTIVAAENSGASWLQVKELGINSALNWQQMVAVSDTSNPSSPGDWDPYNYDEVDTRTITWDYSHLDFSSLPEFTWCSLHIQATGDGNPSIFHFDNCRFMDSRQASNPDPQDRAMDVQTDPILIWKPGKNAKKHDVYFGTDYDFVKDANRTSQLGVLIKQDHDTNSIDIANDVGALAFEIDYYWRIDEVNGIDICKGGVWKFTTGHYLVVDDFELYNPNLEDTWIASSKAAVSLSTDPVHGGDQAMAIDYNNNTPVPYYSEAYADTTGPNSLGIGTDWTVGGVEGLSLWFRGYPDVRGSFTGTDPYTIESDGWDIEDTSDGFHYAYKQLTTITWQIVAKVLSVDDTGDWAKAGIMVRETLEPNSTNAAIVVTPGNGVGFQYRESDGGDTTSIIASGFTPPHWVRLTRGDVISAEHANDVGGNPDKWTQVGDTLDLVLTGVGTPIYIGLCVSSFDSLELCTAQFSNVSMQAPLGTPLVGPWADEDIGIPYNSPEPMYVVLEDSNSDDGTVYYENKDPNATQKSAWTHWGIELDEFSAQEVDLTDVQRMYIGFGDLNDPTPGGTGTVSIDDIRLYAPGCVRSNRTADFAEADYAPEGNPSGDCVVDFKEIEIMGRDWLKTPPPNTDVDLYLDNIIDFRDFAVLAQMWLEEQISLWP